MVTGIADQGTLKRSFLVRLRDRFRYGVLAHELFEQIGRRTGFYIYPYAIFSNTSDQASEQSPPTEFQSRLKIRGLRDSDTELIEEISVHLGQQPGRVLRRLSRESCVVALVDDTFAVFDWASTVTLSTPITRGPLFDFERN